MALTTAVNGSVISSTGSEWSSSRMGAGTKDPSSMATSRVKAFSNSPTALYMMERYGWAKCMGMAFISGLMVVAMSVRGLIIACTARESSPGLISVNIRGITRKTQSQATAKCSGQTVATTRDNGIRENNTAKAHITRKTVKSVRECG